MSVLTLTAAFAMALRADDVRPELVTTDQPFVIFKAIKGAKHPLMFKCFPGVNELDVVYFGTQKKSGVKLFKTAKDLENISPLRFSMKFADNTPVQIDKKYPGCREAYLGSGLENLFKLAGLYPCDGYKGIALVDEYNAGLPMKWVVSSVEYFKAIKKYVLKGFAAANVVAPEVKPLLLLEIVDTKNSLDASDYEFLNTYFELADTTDPVVKKFFEGASKTVGSISDKTKEALNVGTLAGEALLNAVEKTAKEFDAKKIRDYALPLGVGLAAGYAWKQVQGEAVRAVGDFVWTNMIDQKAKDAALAKGGDAKDKAVLGYYAGIAKGTAIGCGTAALGYLAYRIITDMMAEDDDADDVELVEAVELTEEAQ